MAVAWEVITAFEERGKSWSNRGFAHRLLQSTAAIVGGVGVKVVLLGRLCGMGSDSHIAGILRAKVDPDYNDFQSLV